MPSAQWNWKLRVPEVEMMAQLYQMVGDNDVMTGHISGRHPASAFDLIELYIGSDGAVVPRTHANIPLTVQNLEMYAAHKNSTPPELSIILPRRNLSDPDAPQVSSPVPQNSDFYGVLKYFAEEMGVSPLWFNGPLLYSLSSLIAPVDDDGPLSPRPAPPNPISSASARAEHGASLTGVYGTGDWASVWFSHDMSTGRSQYLIDNLNEKLVSRLVEMAHNTRARNTGLLKFMATDILVCNDYFMQKYHDDTYYCFMDALKTLDNPKALQGSADLDTERYTKLDSMYKHMEYQSCNYQHQSRALTLVQGVIQVRRAYLKKYPMEAGQHVLNGAQHGIDSVRASSQVMDKIIEHRLGYFQGRTNIHMGVLMQRDSSSMITIAVVTMVFLPASLVAGLFSTVFIGTDGANTTISVSPKFWYFFAITIPLTILVFVAWYLWMKGFRGILKGLRKVVRNVHPLQLLRLNPSGVANGAPAPREEPNNVRLDSDSIVSAEKGSV